MKLLYKLFIFLFLVTCIGVRGNRINSPIVNRALVDVPILLEKKFYLNGQPEAGSEEEIVSILQQLVKDVLQDNLHHLPEYIDKNKGIYLDVKGLWTYNELLSELEKEDSYFKEYYFISDPQKKRKSIRDIFIASAGLRLDLYFEDSDNCEVKIRFAKNEKLAYDLNNPYFIRLRGKWYIYRMF